MRIQIIEFFKGIAIGIANVIPGFSGGTMGVILNVYEKFIESLGNILSHPIQTLKKAWGLFLGIAFGIVVAIISVVKLLENFPVPTVLFFVGLILGSIPTIYHKTTPSKQIKKIDIFVFFIAIVVIIVLPLVSTTQITNIHIVYSTLIMVIMGVICASAMVIPGVSGSLVLMAFGFYTYLMNSIGEVFSKIVSWELNNILNPILIVLAFAVGALFGLIFTSKLLEHLFKTHKKTVYVAILGLLMASPVAIIYSSIKEYNDAIVASSPLSYIIGVGMLIFGAWFAFYFSNYKKEGQNEEDC